MVETLDNPSSSSSAPFCPRNPNVCLSGLRQPLSTQHWPCVTLNGSASALGGPTSAFWPSASAMLASLKHCATPSCLCVALCEPWLLLRHSPQLLRFSPGTISAFLSLCIQCPSVATPITDSISLSKPCFREYND